MKKGKFSKVEISYMFHECYHLTDEELAKDLDRSVESINKYTKVFREESTQEAKTQPEAPKETTNIVTEIDTNFSSKKSRHPILNTIHQKNTKKGSFIGSESLSGFGDTVTKSKVGGKTPNIHVPFKDDPLPKNS